MKYSQEWFTIKLAKIRDMMHNDLFRAMTEDEIDAILKEVGVHLRDVEKAVYEVTDLFLDDEIHGLVVNHLLESETDRQAFYARYNIASEFDSICEQMQTTA